MQGLRKEPCAMPRPAPERALSRHKKDVPGSWKLQEGFSTECSRFFSRTTRAVPCQENGETFWRKVIAQRIVSGSAGAPAVIAADTAETGPCRR